jgi:hypothetical protein
MMRTLISWGFALLATYLVGACSESAQSGDTQTNWLKTCKVTGDCGSLECVCGRCTKSCDASDCNEVASGAVCFPAGHQGVQNICEGSEATAICLGSCDTEAQCGSDEQCLEGACVPSNASPVGMTDDASGFCQLWVDSFATYMENCGCGAEASARYRAANSCTDDEGFVVAAAAAVERGSLRYDAEAAAALFARLEAADPLCVEEPYRNLRLDSLEVYSLAGTFSGTHALGEACSSPVGFKGGINDCSEGVCASDGASAGVCIALVEVGQACDASGDENLLASSARLCHDRRAVDSDGEYASAFNGVSCVEGVCEQGLADGAPCSSDEVCDSGRCAGTATEPEPRTCQPKSAPGEACSSSRDCLTGGCRHDLATPVCGELLEDGLPCSYDDDSCASGHCSDETNGVCVPVAPAAIGSTCTRDAECLSGACRGGLCFADICGDYLD